MCKQLNILAPNPYITKINADFGLLISNLENKYHLPSRSLFVQLGLHIYKYSLEDLFICNHFDPTKIDQYALNRNLIYNELYSLINYLKLDMPIFDKLSKDSGSACNKTKIIRSQGRYWETSEKGRFSEVFFSPVSSDIGACIQENIHYIRARRNDTKYEVGLYRKNKTVPFAYAAFSVLDRHYLSSLPQLENIPKSEIFVLTRAYSFPNSPQNTMSVLYSKCFDFLKVNSNASYILTALNQNLFFSGASLLAANFELVATSPMKYYYLDGRYSTRRRLVHSSKKVSLQKFQSGPIMWFGKKLTNDPPNSRTVKPIIVTEEMYDHY